jgi:putative DNA primase/helicase
VVEALRSRCLNATILACVDNDDAGAKAGRSLSGIDRVKVIPPPESFKDFNEFFQHSGTEAVESYIKSALEDLASHNWQEPLPLVAKVEPEPYPLDALPDTIRAAVEEVQAFTKAPIPLVASSALGALSLAFQAMWT